MELATLLKEMIERDGSDLYIAVGAVPSINDADGQLRAVKSVKGEKVTSESAMEFARSIMPDRIWDEFSMTKEANLAYMVKGVGPEGIARFRVNAFWQRTTIALVFRRVRMTIPTLQELKLPLVLREIALAERGIILVTGSTGAGKSTTMASMIDYRNHVARGHIVTIEDPIEFLYHHKKSIVTQRELGIDTFSFEEALKNSLRQAPQVIAIGELRDAETVRFALHAAETGHLVFATLHSTNATITVERILNFFPGELEEQVRKDIAMNLKAVVSQRLVPKIGGGRVVAVEVLVNTPTVINLIKKGELSEIRRALEAENHEGLTSMDKSLYRLVRKEQVSADEALAAADSTNDLQLRLRGIGIAPGSSWDDLADEWEGIQNPYELPSDDTRRRMHNVTKEEYRTQAGTGPEGQAPAPPASSSAPGPSAPATPGFLPAAVPASFAPPARPSVWPSPGHPASVAPPAAAQPAAASAPIPGTTPLVPPPEDREKTYYKIFHTPPIPEKPLGEKPKTAPGVKPRVPSLDQDLDLDH